MKHRSEILASLKKADVRRTDWFDAWLETPEGQSISQYNMGYIAAKRADMESEWDGSNNKGFRESMVELLASLLP